MSYNKMMIIKNLLLFGSGMLFAILVFSLFAAYYMIHTDITEEIEENIRFEDVSKAKLLWKHPQSFLTALEMQYALVYWHFTNSSKKTLYASLKRGRLLLVTIVILFFVILFFALYGSFNIQIQK